MNDQMKWLSVGGVIALITVLGTQGKATIEAAMALPALIAAFAHPLPFGLSSFLLSLALASLVFSMTLRNLKCEHRRDFIAETLALLTALSVTILQQHFGPVRSTPPNVLSAVWIGLLAGLGSPYIVRGMMALTKKQG